MRLQTTFECSVIVAHCSSENRYRWAPPTGPIDIWWNGGKNGNLMLTLAHLLKQNNVWRTRPIRLLIPVPLDQDKAKARQPLVEMLAQARVEATLEILPTDAPTEAMKKHSAYAAVVFMGFEPPSDEDALTFHC